MTPEENLDELEEVARGLETLHKRFVERSYVSFGELTMVCRPAGLLAMAKSLKTESWAQFETLAELAGVDYPGREKRFELVYHFLSVRFNRRLRLKVALSESETVASLVSVYPAANWYEREAWDMFGIWFENHPDLRRLLSDYGFVGHPLRKDFPLTGYVELRYDPQEGRIRQEPVSLTQDLRNFDFESPWEGVVRAMTQPPRDASDS